LLSNAAKFTKENGIISVCINANEDKVIISIKDTGIGIPSEKLDIIFDRFRQVDSLMTRRKEGSGIGLSLVKALVELHEGNISVKSKVGEGTEFIIEFPVRTIDSIYSVYDEIATTNDEKVERVEIEFSDIYS